MNDSERLKAIVDRYADSIFRLCLFYLKNKQDAEDVLQDTFIKLIEKNPAFQSDQQRKAWLFKVAANRCKDVLKSHQRKQTSSLDDLEITVTDAYNETFDLIMKLPDKYRSIVYLFYYEDYSIEQISNVLKCNRNTVKTRLRWAREQLKGLLKGSDDCE